MKYEVSETERYAFSSGMREDRNGKSKSTLKTYSLIKAEAPITYLSSINKFQYFRIISHQWQ